MFTEDTYEGLKQQLALYAEHMELMGASLDEGTRNAIEQDIKIIKARIEMER